MKLNLKLNIYLSTLALAFFCKIMVVFKIYIIRSDKFKVSFSVSK